MRLAAGQRGRLAACNERNERNAQRNRACYIAMMVIAVSP